MLKKLFTFIIVSLCFVMLSGCSARSNSKTVLANPNSENVRANTNNAIPILMYHSIAYEKKNELRVPIENFSQQMKYLKDNNYKTLTMEELYKHLKNNEPFPDKSIVLTFDDGYTDNFLSAYPILKENGFTATIFVITDTIDKDSYYLNSKQLLELHKNGIDIGSHTTNHEKLNKASYEDQLKTLKTSKEVLEKLLNTKIDYIAYPYGKWNEDTLRATKDAGYTLGVTTVQKWTHSEDNILTLNRVRIKASDDMATFIKKVTDPK